MNEQLSVISIKVVTDNLTKGCCVEGKQKRTYDRTLGDSELQFEIFKTVEPILTD